MTLTNKRIHFASWLPMILLASFASGQQESRSLEQLVQLAMTHHYELKINSLRKESWESEKQSSYRLSPLEIGVQTGNNDGPEWDNWIQVNQDLGSPWTTGRNKKYAQLGIDYSDQLDKRLRQEIRFTVSSLYYEFVMAKKSVTLMEEVYDLLSKATEASYNLYQNGEISYTEYLLVRQLYTGMLQRYQDYHDRTYALSSELSAYCGIQVDPSSTKELATDSLEILTWSPIIKLSETLLADNQLLLNQIKQEGEVIKGQYQPSIQLGYFHQSLNRVYGHQGILFGVGIPLVMSGRKNAITQNRIKYESQDLQHEFQRIQLEAELNALNQQLTGMAKEIAKLSGDTNACLKGLQQLQKQLDLGEINTSDFVRFSDIIIEGTISELRIINSHNQRVLRHQFITQNF